MNGLKNFSLFVVLCITMGIKAQDAQFSQFYTNSLYLAPSFAGITGQTRLLTDYRVQWPEMPGAYHTYSFSVDHYINAFNSGLGIFVLNDKAGSGNLSLSNISVQYSYSIKMNENWHCVPGIYFSYIQRSIDYQNLVWFDQISPGGTSRSSVESLPMNKLQSLDCGTSVLVYSDQFWFGTSVDHLFKPNVSFYTLENSPNNNGFIPIKYSLFGGVKLINKGKLFRPFDTSVQFAYLYRQQGRYRQFDMGMYWYNKPLVLGFWYRGIPIIKPFPNQDAFTMLMGIKFDNLSFAYSYDFTISRLIGSTGGAHELSLCYTFKAKMPSRKMKEVPCPDF